MAKKVGAVPKWVLPTALIAGGGLLLWWVWKNGGLTGLLESKDNTSNNTGVDNATKAAGASVSTAGQSRSDVDLNGIATTIYNAGSTNDGAAVAKALQGLGNQADFNRLYQIFGTKKASSSTWSTCNLLGFDCQSFDLIAYVDDIVSDDQKQEINAMLSANGITSQF